MNRPTRFLLAAALLSGCASFSEQECRSANWYSLGEQDARTHGLPPQIDQIVHQCRKFGVQVAEKDYLRGWYDGDQQRSSSRP